MRILHIIDTLGRGGAETLLVNTIKDLPQYHHTICYLGGADDFLEDCKQFGAVFRLSFNGICMSSKESGLFLESVFGFKFSR